MNKDPISMLSTIDLADLILVGDCPNIEMKTMGGETFWNTLQTCPNGWRLQQHKHTKLCRILDEKNFRKAWGTQFAMEEKLKRLTRSDFLEVGDVIGIDRKLGLYEHYAVYLGNGRVIHYQGEGEDFSPPITVHESPLWKFLQKDGKKQNYFVLLFDTESKTVIKLHANTNFMEAEILEKSLFFSIFNNKNFCLHTPKKTIQRAKARIGEERYNLIAQNCEHFAIWCKTGVSCSFQVKKKLYMSEIISWIQPLIIEPEGENRSRLNKAMQIIAMDPSEGIDYINKELFLPNLPTPTMGGEKFWNTLADYNGWRLQQNMFIKHMRILMPDNIRVAWGTAEEMCKALDKLVEGQKEECENKKTEISDII